MKQRVGLTNRKKTPSVFQVIMPGMRPEFAGIPFLDRAKAEANLERLDERIPSSLEAPLASLLAQSPDPDGALNLLERHTQRASREAMEELARYPSSLTYLVAIFGHSGSLAESFLAEPSLAIQFARDRNFTKLKSKEDLMQDYARFSTTNPDVWLSAQLARFKRRNYLRIVLKDVLRLATLADITLELSALADVILTNALIYCDQELEKRYGQPQYRDVQGRIVRSGFGVVSLGKLGGNELNYSSDIDLLFLYSHDGETAGGSERHSVISNKEYFVRLAHAITRTITQATPHGQVFRVDLRLRPEGEQGDLTISLRSSLEYYEHRARDWELQMLIKARHSAGHPPLTREFLRGVEPYIYGSPTDFEAVESVLWTRERISRKMRESRSDMVDVKSHRGGIRDIEFLTQCLQRLHGGTDTWVRSGGTLLALRKLNDKGWISDRDYAALTSSYEFLRRVEHRVQLEMGQQTHRLPAEPEALDRLARRVGTEVSRGFSPGAVLKDQVQQAFARVDEIYQRVIHPRARHRRGATFELKPVTALVSDQGLRSYESALASLESVAPDLARVVRDVSVPDRARKNVTRLFANLFGSSERFALARREPERVRRALELLGVSEYLGELLIRHPEDLAVLEPAEPSEAGTSSQNAEPGQTEMGLAAPARSPINTPFLWASAFGLNLREKMALLRRHYRTQALQLGARDCLALPSIFSSLHRWSLLAVRSISTALSVAAQAVERRQNGTRGGSTASLPDQMPLVVLGLGRLGLNEFDLASDADLVFVVASETPQDDIVFWTHLAEKTIEVLSSYTSDGTLFAVDTRLRPGGHEGELVVSEDTLLRYISEAAMAWEGLTYLKASPVVGSAAFSSQLIKRLTERLMTRFSSESDLEGELHRMRRRLEREVAVPTDNTKTAPGGYYDVDFCVSYLRLRHRLELPAGTNVADQVAALRLAGLVTEEDARALTNGAAFLRSVDHAVRLVTGRAALGLPEHVGHAEAVETLVRRWGLVQGEETLAKRLRETQQEVRYTYRRLVGAE
jgi:[glutamine synthetase] adenylyltransferase / [glutamine synthetase]-adenylyl-L-tyrosine phosphorylase